MAKIHGKAGRYLSDKTVSRAGRIFVICLSAVGVSEFILGVVFGLVVFGRRGLLWAAASLCCGVGAGFAVFALARRPVESIARELEDLRQGLRGEELVGRTLAALPDDFHVVHDVWIGHGNIDHVVVGPTGVFALDVKNWRGIVRPDGKGELLLNGKPLDEPYVDQYVRRLMGMRERILALAPGAEAFFRGVFVFPSARVDALWGETGDVHCVRDEQIVKYVVDDPRGTKLNPKQIDLLARAFSALARMEPGFDEHAGADGRQQTG